MTGKSEQVGEELRLLLSAAISAVEPILGQLTSPDAPASDCTWCPVCALVALKRGEQHPLLTAISDHGVTLLALLRDVLADAAEGHGGQAGPGPTPAPGTDGAADEAGQARPPSFERISVRINGADL